MSEAIFDLFRMAALMFVLFLLFITAIFAMPLFTLLYVLSGDKVACDLIVEDIGSQISKGLKKKLGEDV